MHRQQDLNHFGRFIEFAGLNMCLNIVVGRISLFFGYFWGVCGSFVDQVVHDDQRLAHLPIGGVFDSGQLAICGPGPIVPVQSVLGLADSIALPSSLSHP